VVGRTTRLPEPDALNRVDAITWNLSGLGRVELDMDPVAEVTGDPPTVFAEEWDPLWRMACLLTGDRQLGEDITQEAFVRWYERRASVENPAAFLRTVVTNLAKGAIRKRAVVSRWSHLFVREASSVDEPEVMSDLLNLLSVRQRAVIILRFYERRSESEIAEILGCRVGTVKSLSSRALAILRSALVDTNSPVIPAAPPAPSLLTKRSS
jgi:RNA polymerase sigma factor (sigma-70 family)